MWNPTIPEQQRQTLDQQLPERVESDVESRTPAAGGGNTAGLLQPVYPGAERVCGMARCSRIGHTRATGQDAAARKTAYWDVQRAGGWRPFGGDGGADSLQGDDR